MCSGKLEAEHTNVGIMTPKARDLPFSEERGSSLLCYI